MWTVFIRRTVFVPGNSRALMPASREYISSRCAGSAPACLWRRGPGCLVHKPWVWAEARSTLGMGLSHDHGREGWKDLIGARDTHGRSPWSASEEMPWRGIKSFEGLNQGLSPLSPIWILECPIMVIMLSKQTQRHRTGLSQPLSVHVPSSCAPCQKSVQACLWACQAGSHERSGTVVHGRRQNTMSETSWSTSALVYLRTRRFPAFWMCLHTAHRMHRPLLSWLLTALSSQTCKTIVQLKIFNSYSELFHSQGKKKDTSLVRFSL